MKVKVRIAASVMERLRAYHLAPGKRAEALSYLWAQAYPLPDDPDGGLCVLVPHTAPLMLFAPDCFLRQSGGNVQLDPAVLNGLLVRFAASSFNCLVNVHDHWFSEQATFSGVDDRDDRIFDRYLRERFEPMLRRHPHLGMARPIFNLSVVLGQQGLDARLIDGRRSRDFAPVNSFDVVGDRFERLAVGLGSAPQTLDEVFDRQRDFVPAAQQRLLAALDVALVGCGGLGSILAEALARLGVGGLVLVDDDRLEATNLNRWQGGSPASVGQPKATHLGERLRAMFPRLRLRVVDRSVFAPEAERALSGCDLIVGGLDNDEARYHLNRVALQYSLPWFDAGCAVTGVGAETDFRVRMFAILPGVSACGECTQYILWDRERTLEAFLDEATARSRRAAGYVLDAPAARTPSVYAVNQRAAALLETELLNYFCGWRPTATMISESWRAGTFQRADRENFPETPDPECPICSYYAGVAQTEPLPRPRAMHAATSLAGLLLDAQSTQTPEVHHG